ncbi:MAG: hypothetical protein ACRCTD_08775 [Beijerinckiaceae bacterium]
MIIETVHGPRSAFRIERAPAGEYQVRRVAVLDLSDIEETVMFRNREVAIAYGHASAALDRYLAALEHSSDAQEEFETWMVLDEIFELQALASKDSPRRADQPVSIH